MMTATPALQSAAAQAATLLRNCTRLAVLTGAGVSKESGVPTFRDAQSGLWAKYDPQQLATPQAFERNPKMVWEWYEYRRELMRDARPNPGHGALAALEQRISTFTLITQNIDDLHEQAGSHNVIHLHGRIAQNKCVANCQGNPTLIDVTRLTWNREQGPPACPHCGRWVRPDVVWFGEALPQAELNAALNAATRAQVMLVVGTSGLVAPASQLPYFAKQNGAQVVEVNPDETPITALADVVLRGPSGVALPLVLAALEAK